MPELLDRLVAADQRRRLFERADEAYAALQADSDAWTEELAERRAWEATPRDGLGDDAVTSFDQEPTTATPVAA